MALKAGAISPTEFYCFVKRQISEQTPLEKLKELLNSKGMLTARNRGICRSSGSFITTGNPPHSGRDISGENACYSYGCMY